MENDLFPYQESGAAFLAARRCALLADEPRVGKTPAVIRACDLVSARSILVVAPAVARADWCRKFEQFSVFPRKIAPMFSHGKPPEDAEVVVTSYSLVSVANYWRKWDVIVADESHMLKSMDAHRTKTVLGANGLVHDAKHIWWVTGTPSLNNASELWTMLYVAGVYKHGYEKFLRDFCKGFYSDYGFRVTGTKNHEKLQALLSNFMLRRTMAEVRPDIPPITFDDYAVTVGENWVPHFPAKEQALADRLAAAKDPVRMLEENATAFASLRRHIGLMKVEPTAQHIEQLDLPKLVVFAIHRDVIEGMQKRLAAFNPVVLHGDTPESAREQVKKRFAEDASCRIFIGQIQAAGTNVDLSAANHSCIMEPSVVPGDNKQAANRMQNVNKTDPCFCEFISLANSVDEKVSRIYRRKAADISTFIPN